VAAVGAYPAALYDTQAHHFHQPEGGVGEPIEDRNGKVLFAVGSGAQCVQCHMPGRKYMGIDYRPDHSFRIPRPDLSRTLGTPNACNRCHWDKDPQWADAAMTKWYGPGRAAHYGSILAAGRRRDPGAGADLIALAGDPLYPVIVRATALDLLGQYPGAATRAALAKAAADPEALIRHSAVSQFGLLPPAERRSLLADLIHDPVSAVRMEAANQLSALAGLDLPPEQAQVYETSLSAYIDAMTYNADFAFGRFNLGNLHRNQGNTEAAMAQYRAALKIDSQFFPAMVNLAMLANQRGDNTLAEAQFRQALAVNPELFEVHYSLGLLLAEMKQYPEAAQHLARAAEGMPAYARVHFNLGQLWAFLGEADKARVALERAYDLAPQRPDHLEALVGHHLQQRQFKALGALAERLRAEDPDNPFIKRLLDLTQGGGGTVARP
jgi:tetratricopeptide (TPR) repeat protein